MDRRAFLKRLASGVGGGALLLAACANPAGPSAAPTPSGQAAEAGTSAPGTSSGLQQINWTMATSWDPSLDIINGGAQRIAEQVRAMTGERFQITVLDQSRSEAVAPLGVLDAVTNGEVQAGHSASYYYLAKHPAFAFATTVPFGLNAQQQNAWLYQGGGLELLEPLFESYANVRNFPAGNSGVQMGGWFKDEVYTLDDLALLSMRIPGAGGQVMERLGAKTVPVDAGQILQTFRNGQINAAEFIGPYDDEKLGLQNVAEFYYFPGWWEPGATFDAYVNLDVWNSLSAMDQAIFETACRDANLNTLARYDAENYAALQRLIKGGVKPRFFNDRILAPAKREATKLYEETASGNAEYAQVYQQWNTFRSNINGWHWYNEISYMNSVIREFSP